MARSECRMAPKLLRFAALVSLLACLAQSSSAQNGGYPQSTPGWTLTGELNVARYGHTATLLQNGKVLVVGGDLAGTAELYDPATGTWSLTGSLLVPLLDVLTAERLPDGSVLVIGDGTSERYDPASGTWTFAGRAIADSSNATALLDGRVLIAGGWGDYDGNVFKEEASRSASIYDPRTGTWSGAGTLEFARYWSSATRLGDGRVLVARGTDDGDLGSTLSSAEIYDPVAGTWSIAGAVGSEPFLVTHDVASDSWPGAGVTGAPSVQHTATLLGDGKVLFAGGYAADAGGCCAVALSSVFDPATLTSTRIGDLATPRFAHTATRLPNGDVLIAGGRAAQSYWPNLQYSTFGSVERLAEGATTWTSAASLNVPRSSHTATLLADGRVLVAGGMAIGAGPLYGVTPLKSAEIYGFPGSLANEPCDDGKNHYILGCSPPP